MIRLVAIDLDGTLLSPDKTISPANKQLFWMLKLLVYMSLSVQVALSLVFVQFLKKLASKVTTPTL